MRGVKEDPHDSVVLLLLLDLLLVDGLVQLGGLLGEPVAELLAHVLLAGELAGGLESKFQNFF